MLPLKTPGRVGLRTHKVTETGVLAGRSNGADAEQSSLQMRSSSRVNGFLVVSSSNVLWIRLTPAASSDPALMARAVHCRPLQKPLRTQGSGMGSADHAVFAGSAAGAPAAMAYATFSFWPPSVSSASRGLLSPA